MPKQFLKLSNFNNGLVDAIDARDIPDNALAKAENISVDKTIGVITNAPTFSDHSDLTDRIATIQGGYGLFLYEADHDESGNDTGKAYIAISDEDPGVIYVQDINDPFTDSWLNISMPNSSNDMRATYHFVDEGLRISDANFGTNNSNRIYQFIKRTHFSGLTPGGSADSFDSWVLNDQKLSAPTRGMTSAVGGGFGKESTLSSTDGSDTALTDTGNILGDDSELEISAANTAGHQYIAIDRDTSTNVDTISAYSTSTKTYTTGSGGVADWFPGASVDYAIYPSAGKGFNLDISTPTGGSWAAGTYQFATTFIYDGNQESLPYTSPNELAVSANDKIQCTVMCRSPFDERITGGRIYIRDSSEKGDWILFGEISLKDGVRSKSFGSYVAWALESQPTNSDFLHAQLVSLSQNVETYEILNGFSHEESSVSIGEDGEGYKTSVIASRRCFVANVKTKNDDGETIQMRDRIMYSPVGRFDTFPRSFFIDVIRGDAEEYVKIESYNDRLLAFKQNTLFVINISSPSPSGWFLEDSYKFKGVDNPGSVVKIEDSGIVFANSRGCYIYDGSSLKNLIDGKIKLSTWSSFIGTSPLVGYDRNNLKIIIAGSSSGQHAYQFSLRTDSWAYMPSIFSSQEKTNFITDYNGDAIVGQYDGSSKIEFKKVVDFSSITGTSEVHLKDIDFGNPGQLKKIYSITVTYKSDGSTMTDPIGYYTDGGTSATQFTDDFANTATYKILRATPASPFTCQSLQPRLNLSYTSNSFEIKDITIEYRPIYKRVSST